MADPVNPPATDTPTLVVLKAIDGSTAPFAGTIPAYGFIGFQDGPVAEAGVNGTSIEEVLSVVIERLDGYQHGPFPCAENAEALLHLRTGLAWLERRTAQRRQQGVEGTNAAHDSTRPLQIEYPARG